MFHVMSPWLTRPGRMERLNRRVSGHPLADIFMASQLILGSGLLKITHIYIYIHTGWWFQTFGLFSIMYGMSSFPLTNSYFSRWLLHRQPASHIIIRIRV